MQWTDWLGHYQESAEGYRVSRCRIGQRFRYTAWVASGSANPYAGRGWEMLGCHDSAEDARVQCEERAEEVRRNDAVSGGQQERLSGDGG